MRSCRLLHGCGHLLDIECDGDEAAVRPRVDGADALHVLTHRADEVVPILVVVQVLQTEDVLADPLRACFDTPST